jgi:hypothetical protein
MVQVVPAGLDSYPLFNLDSDIKLTLFIDRETNIQFWTYGYSALIDAFRRAGYQFFADAKHVVAVKPNADSGDLVIGVYQPASNVEGSIYIVPAVVEAEVEPEPVDAESSAEQLDTEPEPVETTSDVESSAEQLDVEPTEEIVVLTHPFGPGLDGPAPWETDTTELPVMRIGLRQSSHSQPAPVFAPTAPGLDVVIPTREQAPPAQAPEPLAKVAEPSEAAASMDYIAMAAIGRASFNPLGPWAAGNTVVGTDPSSTTIAGEVERVVDELRRSALAGNIPGLNPVVARALSKRVTASDYWIAVKLQQPIPSGSEVGAGIIDLMIDGHTALAVSRPLADLVDGDNFQVLPPWVRQVVIATSIIEMIDQIKAAAKTLGISPLSSAG